MMNACVMLQCLRDLVQQQCTAAHAVAQAEYVSIAEPCFTAEELFSCHLPDPPCAASSAQEQHSSRQADGSARKADFVSSLQDKTILVQRKVQCLQ